MEEMGRILYQALRDGFAQVLEESGILEELDLEGCVVDAVVAWLDVKADDELKKRLRKLLGILDEE